MLKSLSATRIPILIGALAVVALAAAEFLMPKDWRDALRELGFDQVLAADHALRPAKAEHAGLPVVGCARTTGCDTGTRRSRSQVAAGRGENAS